MYLYSWKNRDGEWKREYAMTKEAAREALLISIRWEWEENGWHPTDWEIKWDKYCFEGGTLWRA